MGGRTGFASWYFDSVSIFHTSHLCHHEESIQCPAFEELQLGPYRVLKQFLQSDTGGDAIHQHSVYTAHSVDGKDSCKSILTYG